MQPHYLSILHTASLRQWRPDDAAGEAPRAQAAGREVQGGSMGLQVHTPRSLQTKSAGLLTGNGVMSRQVWAIFLGGAAVLFGTTLAVENNDEWFPAISRANKAMQQMVGIGGPV
eukprot:scaffold145351_cov21-Prasinocladus_malaysianus.AAC.1